MTLTIQLECLLIRLSGHEKNMYQHSGNTTSKQVIYNNK